MGNKQPTKTKRFFNDFTLDSIESKVEKTNTITQQSTETNQNCTILFELNDQVKIIPKRQRGAVPTNSKPISTLVTSEDIQWKQCVAQYYLSTRFEFPQRQKPSHPKKTIDSRDEKSRFHARNPKIKENNELTFKDVEDELKTQILKFQLEQFEFPPKKKGKSFFNFNKNKKEVNDHSFDNFLRLNANIK